SYKVLKHLQQSVAMTGLKFKTLLFAPNATSRWWNGLLRAGSMLDRLSGVAKITQAVGKSNR
ncbi:MAG TPA: hypothetical protein VKY39_10285, partial [Aggregatilineales bacterium]|nr:hypothetical protein [Aggregatilineales bacterium]